MPEIDWGPIAQAVAGAVARPPVTPVVFGATGAYGAVRSDPKDGACGIHPYPCTHPGVDLEAPKGTDVVAPHAGWVLVSQATNDPPFVGYGPAVVLLAHDDYMEGKRDEIGPSQQSQLEFKAPRTLRYSLLAHLDPLSLKYALPWKQAQGLTDTDDAKKWRKLDDGTIARIADWPGWAVHVNAGDLLGAIGDAGHVHWEMRTSPLKELGDVSLMNPLGWLHAYDPSIPWDQVPAAPVDRRRAGGAGELVKLGLALWALNELL